MSDVAWVANEAARLAARAKKEAIDEIDLISGAALYTFRQPGTYAYVNHNLIEAAELGATAHFKVDGTWDDDLMKLVSAPGPIASGG